MANSAAQPNDLEDLIIGHFDGTLTEVEEKELAKTLNTSPEAKALFLSYMRLEGRLHSFGRDGFLQPPSTVSDTTASSSPDANVELTDAGQHLVPRRSRMWTVATSVAACAAMLLIAAWGLQPAPVNANTVLQRAQQAAEEPIDRTYRLTITAEQDERASTQQALMVFVRGGGCFVVQPVDGSYAMGSDGAEYWFIPQKGPVWVTDNFRGLAQDIQKRIPHRRLLELAASPHEPLLMQMSSLLNLIANAYDMELVDTTNANEHHLRATLRSSKRARPPQIDFWADAKSGVVVRAEITWNPNRLVCFELMESPALNAQWYHYSSHTANRNVKRLDAAPLRNFEKK